MFGPRKLHKKTEYLGHYTTSSYYIKKANMFTPTKKEPLSRVQENIQVSAFNKNSPLKSPQKIKVSVTCNNYHKDDSSMSVESEDGQSDQEDYS